MAAGARLDFARLVVAAAARDLPRVLDAFAALGLKTSGTAGEEVFPLLDLFFGGREGAGEGFGGRRRAVLQRSPVEALPGDLILFGRVIGLLRGVCSSLGAPLTPMQMLLPYAREALSLDAAVASPSRAR